MFILVLLAIVFVLLLFAVFAVVGKLLGLVLFLVIAALCGAVAEYFLGFKEGVGETLLIGLIGAALGVVVARILHLPLLLPVFGVPIVWTIVGSFIVVGILKLASGNRRSLRL
ncbi:MAG TPA: hypothetical protein VK821_05190 [Dehalococcoidia bacterium]|nr:hypothetical protein [Dehalococcoidia bacterium]